MHDGLRKLKSLEIRNANIIKYSRGGHYFFAIEKHNISVFNAYTFVELRKIVVTAPRIFSLVFADMDKAFAVVGGDGYLNRWKLPSFAEIVQSNRDYHATTHSSWTDYKCIDFVN